MHFCEESARWAGGPAEPHSEGGCAAAQYVAPSRLQLLAGQGLEPALDRVSSQVVMASPACKSQRLYRPAAADERKAEITVAGCICNCTRARICISAAVDFSIVRP